MSFQNIPLSKDYLSEVGVSGGLSVSAEMQLLIVDDNA